ncbi:MAG: transmembrane anchor protein [Phycisphaerales bacterium]
MILFTLVLPAEYGIDPTGIGKLTGLQRMGEIKSALASEAEQQGDAEVEGALDLNTSTDQEELPTLTGTQSHEMSVTLQPNQSTEIKLSMTKGDEAEFTWSSPDGSVFYDLHGDSSEISYHIYEKGTDSTKSGILIAEFDGNHGWYWKNRTPNTVTITLNTNGRYQDIKEMN